MLDWLGSLRIRETDSQRVELGLSISTQILGWGVCAIGLIGIWLALPVSKLLVLLPSAVALVGFAIATLRRRFIFDREAGVMRIQQQIMGIANNAVVPLFHLRAVVVVVRNSYGLGRFVTAQHVAYIDRRVGDPIYLDHSRRVAPLLQMAEAIAEVAELRLEYDAMSRASGSES